MQFDSFSAFIDMGGYGFYVWLSFGVSLTLLALLLFISLHCDKSVKRSIAKKIKREQRLKQAQKLSQEKAEQEQI